jgi:hypothetical protein
VLALVRFGLLDVEPELVPNGAKIEALSCGSLLMLLHPRLPSPRATHRPREKFGDWAVASKTPGSSLS